MRVSQSDQIPAYLHWSIQHDKMNGWDLVYPLGFYELICEQAVENVKEYCMKEMIDPFEVFKTELIEYQNSTN